MATFMETINMPYIQNAYIASNQADRTFIPLVRYGSGNALCFEMSYDHPKKAGNRMNIDSGWFGTNVYYTKYIRYTDHNGFIDTVNFYVGRYSVNQNYPLMEDLTSNTDVITIRNYEVKKQPNEILALNYEIVHLPVSLGEDFIGTEFINNHFLVNSNINQNWKKKFYLYYAKDNFKYSHLEKTGHMGDGYTRKLLTTIDGAWYSTNDFKIEFTHTPLDETMTNWAICDEDGNVYFASNRSHPANNKTRIYFNPRLNRV